MQSQNMTDVRNYLRKQLIRLQTALTALDELEQERNPSPEPKVAVKKTKHLSEEAKRKISQRMAETWKQRKAELARKSKAAAEDAALPANTHAA